MRHGDRWTFLEFCANGAKLHFFSDDATAPVAQLHRLFQAIYNPEHELKTKGVHILLMIECVLKERFQKTTNKTKTRYVKYVCFLPR